MDSLAKHIADLERKVTAFNMDPLPLINSRVYSASMGDCDDFKNLADDVGALPHLSELCAIAEAAADAHALLVEELENRASQK